MDSRKKIDSGERMVSDYLKSHPDFLRDHPALLRELSVPHPTAAGVSSLIERQVLMLRNQCNALQQELDLHRTRDELHDTLLQSVHAATIRILRCNDPDSAYNCAQRCLKRDYAADEFRLYVFTDLMTAAPREGFKFMPRSAKLKYLFIELLNRNKPLCGSLQDEHIRLLFQGAAGHVNSTVIVPMRYSDWEGLVAVGSHEHGRYGRGFDLEMVKHLFAVLGQKLDELIRTATA